MVYNTPTLLNIGMSYTFGKLLTSAFQYQEHVTAYLHPASLIDVSDRIDLRGWPLIIWGEGGANRKKKIDQRSSEKNEFNDMDQRVSEKKSRQIGTGPAPALNGPPSR